MRKGLVWAVGLLASCVLAGPGRADEAVTLSLTPAVLAGPEPERADVNETVTWGLSATFSSNPAPTSELQETDKRWTWALDPDLPILYTPPGGETGPAAPEDCAVAFSQASAHQAGVLLTGSFKRVGSWSIPVKVGLTYTDPGNGKAARGSGTLRVGATVVSPHLTISTDKTAICAGGLPTSVHVATLTVGLTDRLGRPLANRAVSLTQADSDPNYPATLAATTLTTDAAGLATTQLTSSVETTETVTVTATRDYATATTPAITSLEGTGAIALGASVVPSGGSNCDLNFTLMFGLTPVEGHRLQFYFETIKDPNGQLVYQSEPEWGSTDGYGSVSKVASHQWCKCVAPTGPRQPLRQAANFSSSKALIAQ